MFERFTEGARRSVVLAREEALRMSHDHVGTGHILLGLLRWEQGTTAEVLSGFGVALGTGREWLENEVGHGSVRIDRPLFAPCSKTVMEYALRESMELGDGRIDTVHILLGLLHKGQGLALRLLTDLGAEPEAVRSEVLRSYGVEPHLRGARAGTSEARPSNLRLVTAILLELRKRGSQEYGLLGRAAALELEALNPGTVYKTLRRMEKDGLCESRWEASPEGRPARRVYTITDAGRGYLYLWGEGGS